MRNRNRGTIAEQESFHYELESHESLQDYLDKMWVTGTNGAQRHLSSRERNLLLDIYVRVQQIIKSKVEPDHATSYDMFLKAARELWQESASLPPEAQRLAEEVVKPIRTPLSETKT